MFESIFSLLFASVLFGSISTVAVYLLIGLTPDERTEVGMSVFDYAMAIMLFVMALAMFVGFYMKW